MKYIVLLMLLSTVVEAKVYKCEINGRMTYQQSPCLVKGNELVIFNDLTETNRISAKLRLEQIVAGHKQAKLDQQEQRKQERIIRAEEKKAAAMRRNAFASERSAYQAKRQADAMERANGYSSYDQE